MNGRAERYAVPVDGVIDGPCWRCDVRIAGDHWLVMPDALLVCGRCRDELLDEV